MIGLKKILIASSFLSSVVHGLTPCTKDWASEGKVKGQAHIFGIGVSSTKDTVAAKAEAQQRAIQDVVAQIRTSVESSAKLSETEKNTGFESLVKTSSNMSDVVGIKIIKEGSDPAQGITVCVGATLNVQKAYEIPEGKMKSLEKQIEEVNAAVKSKKWLDVVRLSKSATAKIEAAATDIALADMYHSFLISPDKTWFEKFQTVKVDIESTVKQAKEQVVFVGPSGPHEIALGEIESQISGQGYQYVSGKAPVGKIAVLIEIKPIGSIRKTKTALGHTVMQTIIVTVRDGVSKKELASNKGASVTGTGQSEDSALANIDRQLVSHILNALRQALPGLIEE